MAIDRYIISVRDSFGRWSKQTTLRHGTTEEQARQEMHDMCAAEARLSGPGRYRMRRLIGHDSVKGWDMIVEETAEPKRHDEP